MINLENYLIPASEASDEAFITGEYIPEMSKKVFDIIKRILPSSGWDILNYSYDARDYSSTFNIERNESNINELITDDMKLSLGRASKAINVIIKSYRSKLPDSDKWSKVYIKYEKDSTFKTRFSYDN